MYTYSVTVTTEKSSPVELYRGTDGFRARTIYRNALYPWMTEGTGYKRWMAWGFSPFYGYSTVTVGIVCGACGGVSGVFDHYCGRCGEAFD